MLIYPPSPRKRGACSRKKRRFFKVFQGQTIQWPRQTPRRSRYRARLGIPDLPGILADRAIAGEPAAAGHIDDCHGGPCRGILAVERADALLGLNVTVQIGQVHVVISMRQERLANRFVEARLTGVDVVAEEQVDGGARFRLVMVVPVRAVPGAAGGDLVGGQAVEENVFLTDL